jgi:micrococcal nuclease
MRYKQLSQSYWLFFVLLHLACSRDTEGQQKQKVVGIMDGDTIELLEDRQTTRVRLYGIDAPEKNQDYGTRSRQVASDLAFGKNVQLIEKGKDRYGRVIGIIILPDGRSLNEEMVRQGYAWHYKEYAKDPVLAQLEVEARQNRRGLWEMPQPTAPWEFRSQRRAGGATAAAPAPASKPRARSGPATGADVVYICDSRGATAYHASSTCPALKRCKSEVKRVTLQEALASGRKPDQGCGATLPN